MLQEVMSYRIGNTYIFTGLVWYSTVLYAASGKKYTLAVSRGEILITKSCTRCSVELVIQVRVTLGNVFDVVVRAWIPVETELA